MDILFHSLFNLSQKSEGWPVSYLSRFNRGAIQYFLNKGRLQQKKHPSSQFNLNARKIQYFLRGMIGMPVYTGEANRKECTCFTVDQQSCLSDCN